METRSSLWGRLTEPARSVTDPIERRRASLVSSLIVTVTPIAFFTGTLLFASADPRFTSGSLVGIYGACLLLLVMYGISRSRHYRVAVWWLSTMTTLIACGVVIANPQDPGWYAFAILTPIMAGTLLPLRTAGRVIIGHAAALSIVAFSTPGIDDSVRIVASMVAVMGGGLVYVAARFRSGNEQLRKRQLEERERRLREVLDVAFDGIAVLHDGRIMQANRGFAAVFAADLEGTALLDLFEGDDRDRVAALLDGETRETLEVRSGRVAGHVLELVANAPTEGARAADVIAVRDITARRQTELELQHSQRLEAVGRLAGGVAHDFNNLLMVLGAEAEMLGDDLGDAHAESLEAIQAATHRAAELTRQLLAFSRRQLLQPEVVDLHEVLESMRRLLARTLGEDVVLRTHSDPGLHVLIDPGQLEQVVVNLAVNARDAMPGGGKLSLRARHEGTSVFLEVQDTGEGIAEEHVEHVFEPFFTTKARGKGTGLGLSVVLGIVEQSGGEISVSSSAGKGTTFTLRFPLAEPSAACEAKEVIAPKIERGQTILLVEDEVGVSAVIERMLEPGNQVLVANSGIEAAALLDALDASLDLAVIDLVLQDRTGVEVAEEVRRRYPDAAVLHISGYTDVELPEGVALLRKPFTSAQLKAAVVRLQQRRARARANS